jgi:alkylation response protein AidB-like acyl-CoA dehydrogenase
MGLRSTGSHDVRFSEVFVPSHMAGTLSLGEPNALFSGPLYKARLWSGHPAFAATALGVARAALDEGLHIAQTKTANFAMQPIAASTSVQRLIGKAEAKWRSARAYLYSTIDEQWAHQERGEFVTNDHAIAMQLASSHVIEASREVTELVHEASGTTGFRMTSPLEQLFRDAHTMSQHAFASQTRYESAVKAMFGMPNDWAFFQL